MSEFTEGDIIEITTKDLGSFYGKRAEVHMAEAGRVTVYLTDGSYSCGIVVHPSGIRRVLSADRFYPYPYSSGDHPPRERS